MVGVAFDFAEKRDVEERNVETDKADECAEDQEEILPVGKCSRVPYGTSLWWLYALLHYNVGKDESGEGDEANDSYGPTEANPIDQTVEYDGKDDTTHGGTGGGNPDGETKMFAKVAR